MFERHAPASLAGRILYFARLWWNNPRGRRAAVPPLAGLSDHLRRDIGLPPTGRREYRYPLNWPWQRF